MRHMAKLIGLCVLLLLPACAQYDNALPPQVSLADIKLLNTGLLSQDMQIDLKVRNPNNFDLPLEGLTFALDLNDSRFSEGFTNESVTIPRLGEATIPVRASTGLLDLLNQALVLGRGGDLNYRITGLAYLSGITSRSVPYEKAGKLQLFGGSGGGTGGPGSTLVPI